MEIVDAKTLFLFRKINPDPYFIVMSRVNGIDIRLGRFVGLRFYRSKLIDSVLRMSDFSISNIEYCSFANSDLRASIFNRAEIKDSSFRNTLMRKSKITNAVLRGVNFTNSDLRRSDLSYSHFIDCNFENADMRGVNSSMSFFINCSFKRANLTGAGIYNNPYVKECNFSAAIGSSLIISDEERAKRKRKKTIMKRWAKIERMISANKASDGKRL